MKHPAPLAQAVVWVETRREPTLGIPVLSLRALSLSTLSGGGDLTVERLGLVARTDGEEYGRLMAEAFRGMGLSLAIHVPLVWPDERLEALRSHVGGEDESLVEGVYRKMREASSSAFKLPRWEAL